MATRARTGRRTAHGHGPRASRHCRHSRLLDLGTRRDWLPVRHEGDEQLRTRSAVPLPEGTPFRTKSAAVPTNQGTRENAPGEDAMKRQKILFSFDGRIGRRTYWLAILALIVALTSQVTWFLGTGQSVRIAPVGELI